MRLSKLFKRAYDMCSAKVNPVGSSATDISDTQLGLPLHYYPPPGVTHYQPTLSSTIASSTTIPAGTWYTSTTTPSIGSMGSMNISSPNAEKIICEPKNNGWVIKYQGREHVAKGDEDLCTEIIAMLVLHRMQIGINEVPPSNSK